MTDTADKKLTAQVNYTALENAVTAVLAEIAAVDNTVTGEETAVEKANKAQATQKLRMTYASATQLLQPALDAFVDEFGTAPILTAPDYVSVPEVKKPRKVSDSKCSETELNERITALSVKCDELSVAYTAKPTPAKYERLAKANKAYQDATTLFIERFPAGQLPTQTPEPLEVQETVEVQDAVEAPEAPEVQETVEAPVMFDIAEMFDFSVATTTASSFEESVGEALEVDAETETAKAVKNFVAAKKAEPPKVKKVILKKAPPADAPIVEAPKTIEPPKLLEAVEPQETLGAEIQSEAKAEIAQNWEDVQATIAGYSRNTRAKKLGFRTMSKDAWVTCQDIKAKTIEGLNRTASGMWEMSQSHPDYVCNEHASEKAALFPGYNSTIADESIVFYNLMLRYQDVVAKHFESLNIEPEFIDKELMTAERLDIRARIMLMFPKIDNLMAVNGDKQEFARLTELETALSNCSSEMYDNYQHPPEYHIAFRKLTPAEIETARIVWQTPEQRALNAVLAGLEPVDAPFDVSPPDHALSDALAPTADIPEPLEAPEVQETVEALEVQDVIEETVNSVYTESNAARITPESLDSICGDMQQPINADNALFLAVDNTSKVLSLETDPAPKLPTKNPVGNAAKAQPDGHFGYQDNKSAEWLEAQEKRLIGDAETDAESMPLFAIVRYIRDVLNNAGYITEYSANGNFGGLNVFKRVKLACDGIDHEASKTGQFQISTRLEVTDKTVSELYRVLMKSPPKTSAKAYRAVVTELLNAPGDVNSAILKLTSTRRADNHGRTTLIGADNAIRFCPTTATSKLKFTDSECLELLSIFDEPEARALMLTLGRVMVGENGSLTTEGTVISHTSRMLTLIVGIDPGLGKTTLFEQFLIPTIQKLGYTVAGVPLGLNDKGWIAPALADLAFVDDLTATSQQAIFESAVIKSLVSNVELDLDAKYKAFRRVKSRCQVIMCSNGYNMADSLNADSGVMSRLHTLSTVPASKVYRPKQNFDRRTLTVWNEEATKRGVSVETLAYALLARCSEYFLDVNGYTFTGDKYERTAPDTLMLTTEALREQYRLKVTMSHAKTLIQSLAHWVALSLIRDTPNYDREVAIKKLMEIEFAPLDIVSYIKFGTLNQNEIVPADCLVNNTEVHWAHSFKNLKNVGAATIDTLTTADALLLIVDKLESAAGFKYPRKMPFYCSMWNSAISEASYNFAELEALLESKILVFRR